MQRSWLVTSLLTHWSSQLYHPGPFTDTVIMTWLIQYQWSKREEDTWIHKKKHRKLTIYPRLHQKKSIFKLYSCFMRHIVFKCQIAYCISLIYISLLFEDTHESCVCYAICIFMYGVCVISQMNGDVHLHMREILTLQILMTWGYYFY